jgi:hypothetical protein
LSSVSLYPRLFIVPDIFPKIVYFSFYVNILFTSVS